MPKSVSSRKSTVAERAATRRRLFVPVSRTATSPPLFLSPSPTITGKASVEPPLVLLDAGGVCVVLELLVLVLAEIMPVARISLFPLCSTSRVSLLSGSRFSAGFSAETAAAGAVCGRGAAAATAARCLRICVVAWAATGGPRLVEIAIARSRSRPSLLVWPLLVLRELIFFPRLRVERVVKVREVVHISSRCFEKRGPRQLNHDCEVSHIKCGHSSLSVSEECASLDLTSSRLDHNDSSKSLSRSR